MLIRNLRPAVRRVQRSGERTTGVVTAVRDWPAGTIGVSRWTATLQAKAGGRTVTFRRYLDSSELHGAMLSPGDRLPLRYAADDPERIEIDFAEFRREQAERDRRFDERRVRDALAEDD